MPFIDFFEKKWLGQPIRKVSSEKEIFLTFDDGPDPLCTPHVLDVLDQYSAKACFFVVAEQAAQHPSLTREIVARGHSIGNHSLDHKYGPFFGSKQKLASWINEAQIKIYQLTQYETIGFRPPAGVLTPPLGQALKELNIPLVLWSQRFYDSIWPLTKNKVDQCLKRLQAGDIVLLHDRQSSSNKKQFVSNLSFMLEQIQNDGFHLKALQKEHFKDSTRAQPHRSL